MIKATENACLKRPSIRQLKAKLIVSCAKNKTKPKNKKCMHKLLIIMKTKYGIINCV